MPSNRYTARLAEPGYKDLRSGVTRILNDIATKPVVAGLPGELPEVDPFAADFAPVTIDPAYLTTQDLGGGVTETVYDPPITVSSSAGVTVPTMLRRVDYADGSVLFERSDYEPGSSTTQTTKIALDQTRWISVVREWPGVARVESAGQLDQFGHGAYTTTTYDAVGQVTDVQTATL